MIDLGGGCCCVWAPFVGFAFGSRTSYGKLRLYSAYIKKAAKTV